MGSRWVAKKFDIPCREVRRETASSLLFTTLAKYIYSQLLESWLQEVPWPVSRRKDSIIRRAIGP